MTVVSVRYLTKVDSERIHLVLDLMSPVGLLSPINDIDGSLLVGH